MRTTARAAPRAIFELADVPVTEPPELARVTEQGSGLPRSTAVGVKVLAVALFCAVPLTTHRMAVLVAPELVNEHASDGAIADAGVPQG